jgi:hypothetical protein
MTRLRGVGAGWFAEAIDPRRAPRRASLRWGALAAVCLAGAVWLAVQPGRSADYWDVRRWIDAGLIRPYDAPALDVDYPPHALVILAPLAWLPAAAAPLLLALANTLLSAGMAWLLVRVTADLAAVTLSRAETTALAAMILTWGPVRCAIWMGQSTPVAMVLLLGAVWLARRRPLLAGVCLALGSYKLNIAAGIGLALTLLGPPVVLGIGVVCVAGLTFAIAPVLGYTPLSVTGAYLARLRADHAGADFSPGSTSARTVLHALVPTHAAADVVFAGFAIASLAALIVLARRAPRTPRTFGIVFAASLLWALQSLYHERYNLVLLAPTVLILMWPEMRLVRRERSRRVLIGALLIFLVMDVPLVLRLVAERAPWLGSMDAGVLASLPTRLLIPCLFTFLLVRLVRPARASFP